MRRLVFGGRWVQTVILMLFIERASDYGGPLSRSASILLAAVPVLVVVRIALVRVVIAIGLGIVGHGGLLSMAGSGIRLSGRGVGRRGVADD